MIFINDWYVNEFLFGVGDEIENRGMLKVQNQNGSIQGREK